MLNGLIAAVLISGLSGAANQVSKPFLYAGYSKPEYASFTTFSQYVPMPDGVRLAVDVHRRAGLARNRFLSFSNTSPTSAPRLILPRGKCRMRRIPKKAGSSCRMATRS